MSAFIWRETTARWDHLLLSFSAAICFLFQRDQTDSAELCSIPMRNCAPTECIYLLFNAIAFMWIQTHPVRTVLFLSAFWARSLPKKNPIACQSFVSNCESVFYRLGKYRFGEYSEAFKRSHFVQNLQGICTIVALLLAISHQRRPVCRFQLRICILSVEETPLWLRFGSVGKRSHFEQKNRKGFVPLWYYC